MSKDRYDASELPEAQFQPGARRRVLRNLPGITLKREMDRAEAEAQVRAFEDFSSIYGADHLFNAADISKMHRLWLGAIYPWAGRDRQVQMSKGGFTFAAVRQIPALMAELEAGPLKRHTPCRFSDRGRVITALAEVHTELLLIHPFRDGNGRLARMLAVLMGLQAGLPPLDFGSITGKARQEYFAAVRAGLDRDYRPMERALEKVIERTLRAYEEPQVSRPKTSR